MVTPKRPLTIKRVASRLRRELLRVPPVKSFARRAYTKRLAQHAPQIPPLATEDEPVVRGVREGGVYVTRLSALNHPITDQLRQDLAAVLPEVKRLKAVAGNAPRLPLERLYQFPSIYRWGLDPRILDLAENYIGLPLWYHGAELRREVADGMTTDVRQWHMDVEDRRMFRIIVYLNDVGPDGGPFECITRHQTSSARAALGYHTGFVSDERMAAAVPPTSWRAVTGPAETLVVADTCAVFHRAKPPASGDRCSLTFSWTSRSPLKTYPTPPVPVEARARLRQELSERQLACLPPWT